jgi:hypothetical protein
MLSQTRREAVAVGHPVLEKSDQTGCDLLSQVCGHDAMSLTMVIEDYRQHLQIYGVCKLRKGHVHALPKGSGESMIHSSKHPDAVQLRATNSPYDVRDELAIT